MTVVADSSPLISLAAIGSLDLLPSLYAEIVIPEAVFREVTIVGKGMPGEEEIGRAAWIKRQSIKDGKKVQELLRQARLDNGESEVIVLAGEINATLVLLDDRQARKYAKKQQLPVSGTLGVLLAAKEHGLISSIRTALDDLIAAGFHLASFEYRNVLRKAGER